MDSYQSQQPSKNVATTNVNQNKPIEQIKQFEDSDFEGLDKTFKHSCFIMVPESEILNFTMPTYVNNILKQYDEKVDIKPYVEKTLTEIQEEFKEFEDCFENIEEYCQKIHGGYIEGENVMSTINYNAEWSYYKQMHTYTTKEVPNLNLPINIKCIVDLSKKLHKKTNLENQDEWTARMLKLINDSDDGSLFLAYVEYF